MSKQMNKRSANRYNMAVRGAVIAGTIVAMYISATFSKDGFSFEMGSQYAWMGWALAALAIVIQLAWNRMEGDKGLTIYVIGVSIYAYSIYTNFVGIGNAQSGDGWVFPLLFSLILDILPEPFFVWAVAGITSDPLGKAVSGMSRIINGTSISQPQTESQRSKHSFARDKARQKEISSRIQSGQTYLGASNTKRRVEMKKRAPSRKSKGQLY